MSHRDFLCYAPALSNAQQHAYAYEDTLIRWNLNPWGEITLLSKKSKLPLPKAAPTQPQRPT